MKTEFNPNVVFERGLDIIVLDCCGVTGEAVYTTTERRYFTKVYDSEVLASVNEETCCNAISTLKNQIGEHYNGILDLESELMVPLSIRIELNSYIKKLNYYRSRNKLRRTSRKKFEDLLTFTMKKVNSILRESSIIYADSEKISKDLEGFMQDRIKKPHYNNLSGHDLSLIAKSYCLALENPMKKIAIATADKMILATHYLARNDLNFRHLTGNVEIMTRPYLRNKVLRDLELV